MKKIQTQRQERLDREINIITGMRMGWKVHLSARINDYRQILPDKFMRRPLNPFKFPLLAPFCHRLMEQCFEHRFYSMESNSSQIEDRFNYDKSTFSLDSHSYQNYSQIKQKRNYVECMFTYENMYQWNESLDNKLANNYFLTRTLLV